MSQMSEDQKLNKFADILDSSEYVVFLGGAGVSTESGIPDFRSKNGLYHRKNKKFSAYKPEYLLSYDCLKHKPEVFFDYYRNNLDARTVEPNPAHLKLAEMEKRGQLIGVVTQNIDGLHQKAGSKNVQEIHGTIWRNYCISCGAEYDENYIFDSNDKIPVCEKCGKMVRPNDIRTPPASGSLLMSNDVTLYGEFLPEEAYQNAINMMNSADCLIIGGTSLEVGSAAQLAHLFHGEHLIIINKGKTKLEGRAELVFHDSIGKVLSAL